MANDGAGTTWVILSPANSDARSLGAQEIRGLRAGIAIRMDLEHEDMAGSSAGGKARSGSARAYYGATDPEDRPDGNAVLGSTDTGRFDVHSSTKILRVYDGADWQAVNTGFSASSDGTNVNAAFISASGWTNDTGATVFFIYSLTLHQTSAYTVKIDYGSGFVIVGVAVFASSVNRHTIGGACFVPNGATIKVDPPNPIYGVNTRYQNLFS